MDDDAVDEYANKNEEENTIIFVRIFNFKPLFSRL